MVEEPTYIAYRPARWQVGENHGQLGSSAREVGKPVSSRAKMNFGGYVVNQDFACEGTSVP